MRPDHDCLQDLAGCVAAAVVPGGFDEQTADVPVAGLGDRASPSAGARGAFAGHQPDEGADAVAGEAVPVADLDGERERGQCRDCAQTGQSVHQRGELAAAGQLGDRLVQACAAGGHGQDRVVVGLERHGRDRVVEALPAQPLVVHPGPSLPVGVDDPLTQQQFRQPMPCSHQIDPAVLARPDQIARRLLRNARHRDRGDLTQAQQPSQMRGVAGVGLDPITGRALQLRRRRDDAVDPSSHQHPKQPEARRPGLISHRDRPRQLTQPAADLLMGRGQLRLDQLAGHAIDRRCSNRSCMHIQTNTRTHGTHRGLPHMADRPSR